MISVLTVFACGGDPTDVAGGVEPDPPVPCDTPPASPPSADPISVAGVAGSPFVGPFGAAFAGYDLAEWGGVLYSGRLGYGYPPLGPNGVDVLDGPTMRWLGAWEGENAFNATGAAVAASDVDDDGISEVAIGSFDDGGETNGAVYLVHGAPDLDSASPVLAAATLVFRSNEGVFAGSHLVFASLGSDPDSVELIATGGAVFAIDPRRTGELREPDALRTLRGELPYFGFRSAAVDLDGDGRQDLTTATERGLALFRGPWVSDLVEDDRDAEWTYRRVDSTQLHSVGDLDGDGFEDLGFGVGGWEEPAYRAGRAWIVSGGDVAAGGPADELPVRFEGVEEGEGVGYELTGADVDGDGQQDLVVAATGVIPSNVPGRLLVYPGPVCAGIRRAADASVIVEGEGEWALFGRSLLPRDVDADGRDDLYVGAPGCPDGYGNGCVYLVPGAALSAW